MDPGRLTRYGWNFSVFFYGIIPSNPVASLAIARQKRSHGRIVPNHSAFRKRNHRGQSQQSGLELGYVSAIDSKGQTIWIVDAHRDDGKRFVVHAKELLTAFVELESAIRSGRMPRGLWSA